MLTSFIYSGYLDFSLSPQTSKPSSFDRNEQYQGTGSLLNMPLLVIFTLFPSVASDYLFKWWKT